MKYFARISHITNKCTGIYAEGQDVELKSEFLVELPEGIEFKSVSRTALSLSEPGPIIRYEPGEDREDDYERAVVRHIDQIRREYQNLIDPYLKLLYDYRSIQLRPMIWVHKL